MVEKRFEARGVEVSSKNANMRKEQTPVHEKFCEKFDRIVTTTISRDDIDCRASGIDGHLYKELGKRHYDNGQKRLTVHPALLGEPFE